MFMNRKIGYLIVLFLLTSCWRKTDCPSYPEQNLSWIPYQLNRVIKFSDGIDTLEFIINEKYITSSYSTRDDCWVEAAFGFEIHNDLDVKIEIHSYYFGESTDYNYWFILYDNSSGSYSLVQGERHEFSFYKKNGKMVPDIIVEYEINGKIYKNIVKVELVKFDHKNVSWEQPDIWRIFVTDSVGLIQFDDRNTNKSWTLIE